MPQVRGVAERRSWNDDMLACILILQASKGANKAKEQYILCNS